MEMTKEWAEKLTQKGITFKEYSTTIIFYDPCENDNHVVIREHDKDQVGTYSSRRIGTMSFEDYKTMVK